MARELENAAVDVSDTSVTDDISGELESEGNVEEGLDDGEVSQGESEGDDVEAQARQEGWDPDFKGPPHLKKTAEEFLRDGAHIKKVLKDRNSRLETERGDLKRQLEENKAMMKQLIGFNVEQKRRAEEVRLRELEEAKNAAIYSGDVDEVNKAQQSINKALRESEEPQVDPGQVQWENDFREWKSENSWYDTDHFLSAEADRIAKAYMDTGRFKAGPDLLKAVERRMRKEFSEEIDEYPDGEEDQPKRKVAPVNSPKKKGQVTPNSPRGKSFNDVPKDDQKVYFAQRELFGKDAKGNWVYSQEDFLKSYQFEG